MQLEVSNAKYDDSCSRAKREQQEQIEKDGKKIV
jgi:hypothetical protein